MLELLLDVDLSLGRRRGLEQALRTSIRQASLAPGTSLPSSRSLAIDLGFSRSTVVAAYEQLILEGYLVAERGSGTKVSQSTADGPVRDSQVAAASAKVSFDVDLRPGQGDHTLFPTKQWLRSVRRVVNQGDPQTFGYDDPRGSAPLRRAMAEYLGRSRAVSASAENVSVFAGAISAFGFIGEALRRNGIDAIAVENPSLPLVGQALALSGLTVVPVPVDADGLDVDQLEVTGVRAVVATPSHQYPMGTTMSPGRRARLLDWARANKAMIIEDDYDGEFRFDRSKIGSLQGLDPDHVIYVGTASKSLAAGLRLAWTVLPVSMVAKVNTVKQLRAGVSAIDQRSLADFISRGELDRHLRLVRAEYATRDQALRKVIEAAAPWLEAEPTRAGLHLTATITTDAISEGEVVAQAGQRSIALSGLAEHWSGRPTGEGLVIGFSRVPQHQFPSAIERLESLLSELTETMGHRIER